MKALLPLAFVMAAGVGVLVLAGCTAALPALGRKEAVDTAASPADRLTIPAIDARVPAVTETATFALG
jgi:hypothetical protein